METISYTKIAAYIPLLIIVFILGFGLGQMVYYEKASRYDVMGNWLCSFMHGGAFNEINGTGVLCSTVYITVVNGIVTRHSLTCDDNNASCMEGLILRQDAHYNNPSNPNYKGETYDENK